MVVMGKRAPCGHERCSRWRRDDPLGMTCLHPDEPMSDERLAEIEYEIDHANDEFDLQPTIDMARELLAEVRRLRRALRLSELSRGVPGSVLTPRQQVARAEQCSACAEQILHAREPYPFTCSDGHQMTRTQQYLVPSVVGAD